MNNQSDQKQAIRERIVVALDVATRGEAIKLVDQLAGRVGLFKIGLQLFSAEGPSLVREIVDRGERIFLDLKYHDIPNTVAGAAASATRLGVSIFNVHATGGKAMMAAAVEAAERTAVPAGRPRPIILAVTVLTSMDTATLQTLGVNDATESQVLRLARLTEEAGLDGVVASPLEIKSLRAQIPSPKFVILTPGIRPGASKADDQKRIATPSQALADGADYLVIGRPITGAPDPAAAVEQIIMEASGD